MRHLGYWNQGIVQAYGPIALERPGMQGIVAPWLFGGYPSVNAGSYWIDRRGNASLTQFEGSELIETTQGPNLVDAAFVGGYNDNPELYSTAQRMATPWTGGDPYPEMVYCNAGWRFAKNLDKTVGNPDFDPVQGKNITNAVSYRAANKGTTGTQDYHELDDITLTEDELSLRYLFDPEVENPGKKSYRDVSGLFQLDENGYYYYNMRENFAEFVEGNDQEKDHGSDGHFVLYDAPAVLRTDGTDSIGGFFPFNTAEEVFDQDASGNLVNRAAANNSKNNVNIDHHLGMTMETTFRQPVDGYATAQQPMTFEFIGDDDLWIFIDDVLVLDLGGIHSEVYGSINFATGDINLGTAFDVNGSFDAVTEKDPVIHTTIRHQFEKAGRERTVNWSPNKEATFASNTSHTLKMFYLERGNYDSSLAVRFNLQPELYQQIKKVDQDGNPLKDVEFELYQATVKPGVNKDIADVTFDDIDVADSPITVLRTDEDGIARFLEPELSGESAAPFETPDDTPFNFSDRYNPETGTGLLYVLKESKTPDGYRPLPTDLLLRFNPETTMLIVNNRYTTGAYASFTSTITGVGGIYYGAFNPDTGNIDKATLAVSKNSQQYGLAVPVPMLYQKNYVDQPEQFRWLSLYGSNEDGYKTVNPMDLELDPSNETDGAMRMRLTVLESMLYQMAQPDGAPEWYLEWNNDNQRLEGNLVDLPGRADRYKLENADGDMRMVYGIIEPEGLEKLASDPRFSAIFAGKDLTNLTDHERYDLVSDCVRSLVDPDNEAETLPQAVHEVGYTIMDATNGPNNRGFSMLNVDEFFRNFRSLIYIPNERRELRILKVDEAGAPLERAEFSLYTTEEEAKAAMAAGEGAKPEPYAKGYTDSEGYLVMTPSPVMDGDKVAEGYAEVHWPNASFDERDAPQTYYLCETAAPEGHNVNPTIIPLQIGVYSIYADAGTPEDGVSVMAGVGKIAQTMRKYASDGDVNITLRDIIATAQIQKTGEFGLTSWHDDYLAGTDSNPIPRTMKLHYGVNAVIDYGLHNADDGSTTLPYFAADEGYIRTRVTQNYSSHLSPDDPFYAYADKDNLGDMDITSLFSLVNTVVVTDQAKDPETVGTIRLSKMVYGEELTTEDYTHNYEFRVEVFDEQGVLDSSNYPYYGLNRAGFIKSGDSLMLHHDETLDIRGIPAGYSYRITELNADPNGWFILPATGVIEGTIAGKADSRHVIVADTPFVNVKGAPGSLCISKVVEVAEGATLPEGAREKQFQFKVTFTDADGAEVPWKFPYSKQGIEGVVEIASGDVITLAHGESILVKGLPVGITYKVEELDADQGGLTCVPQGGVVQGTIANASDVTQANFVNWAGTPPVLDPPSEEGDKDPLNPRKPLPNTGGSDPLPQTGDEAPLYPLGALAVLALGSMVVAQGQLRRLRPQRRH